ncbi:MAG TPA: undecaprenyl-phosphate glucose phosphotransferase [Steroidobacteraceae bacterium]|jgi:putative colanic acid biosynthesis UDP-glucose lipid carrier transferase|nr:undecaprenyl-phosphate glucose phosphotransferase [Steroidobacteraceae bacterium]
MTQPVLQKQGFTIALLTGVQAVVPALVAVGSLYVIVVLFGHRFEPSSAAIVVVSVLCLILVQPPREAGTQLTSARLSDVADVIWRWMMMLVVFLAIGYVTKTFAYYPRRVFLTWAVATPAALIAATLVMQELRQRFLMNVLETRSAIIVGYSITSFELARRLKGNPSMRVDMAGFFDDRSKDRLGMDEEANLLGALSDMSRYVKENRTDVIFIALPIRHVKRVMDLLDDLGDTTASIYYVPDVFVFNLIQARSSEVHGIPVVAMCETPFYGYRGVVKRVTDVGLSMLILLLLLPFLVIIAVAIKLSSHGPIIFKQRRYGLDGKEIAVYKFRTMRVTEDGAKIRQASKTDIRITPIGRVLRRSSMDELPQLINVLQGRMSLVGPRPHAVAHNEEYRKLIKGYMLRHKVLPGITGLAQINGWRGETSTVEDMEARVNYDLDYLRHWSPLLDIKILLLTVVKVFRDDKAY